jgi:hypothetical protein
MDQVSPPSKRGMLVEPFDTAFDPALGKQLTQPFRVGFSH